MKATSALDPDRWGVKYSLRAPSDDVEKKLFWSVRIPRQLWEQLGFVAVFNTRTSIYGSVRFQPASNLPRKKKFYREDQRHTRRMVLSLGWRRRGRRLRL